MPPTISAYYRAVIEEIGRVVNATPDDRVIGMNPDEWVEYLIAKHAMEPIVLDESGGPQMEEVESERALRGYDIYSDSGPGTIVRSTNVRVEVPGIPSDIIDRNEGLLRKADPRVIARQVPALAAKTAVSIRPIWSVAGLNRFLI